MQDRRPQRRADEVRVDALGDLIAQLLHAGVARELALEQQALVAVGGVWVRVGRAGKGEAAE